MFLQFGVCDISGLNTKTEDLNNATNSLESIDIADSDSSSVIDSGILSDCDSYSEEIKVLPDFSDALKTVDVEILGIKSSLGINPLIPMSSQKAINMSLYIPEEEWNACESAAKTTRDNALLYDTFIKPLLDVPAVKEELSKTKSETIEYGALSIETIKGEEASLAFHLDFVLHKEDLSLDYIDYYTQQDIDEEDRIYEKLLKNLKEIQNEDSEINSEERTSQKRPSPAESSDSHTEEIPSKKVEL